MRARASCSKCCSAARRVDADTAVGLKLLLVVLVLALAVGWVFKRSRRDRQKPPASKEPLRRAQGDAPPAAATMLACAHCQVHLPKDDAQFDLAGRPYCSAEHRVAGPG